RGEEDRYGRDGEADVAQPSHVRGLGELLLGVAAVATRRVDLGGHEDAVLAVVAQHPHAEATPGGELPDRHEPDGPGHGDHPVASHRVRVNTGPSSRRRGGPPDQACAASTKRVASSSLTAARRSSIHSSTFAPLVPRGSWASLSMRHGRPSGSWTVATSMPTSYSWSATISRIR